MLLQGWKEDVVPENALDFKGHEDLPVGAVGITVEHAREADENVNGGAPICNLGKDGVRNIAEGGNIFCPLPLTRVPLMLGGRVEHIDVNMVVFADGRGFADGGSNGNVNAFENTEVAGDPDDAVDVHVHGNVLNWHIYSVSLQIQAHIFLVRHPASNDQVQIGRGARLSVVIEVEQLSYPHQNGVLRSIEEERGGPRKFIAGKDCTLLVKVGIACPLPMEVLIIKIDGVREDGGGEHVRGDVPGCGEIIHVGEAGEKSHALICKTGPADRDDGLEKRIHAVHGMNFSKVALFDDHVLAGRTGVVVIKAVVMLHPALLVGGRKGNIGRRAGKAARVAQGDVFDRLVLFLVSPVNLAYGSIDDFVLWQHRRLPPDGLYIPLIDGLSGGRAILTTLLKLRTTDLSVLKSADPGLTPLRGLCTGGTGQNGSPKKLVNAMGGDAVGQEMLEDVQLISINLPIANLSALTV